MTQDQLDKLGMIVESISAVNAASHLGRMSAEFHLQQVQKNMENWEKWLKELYVEVAGDNPWDYE